MGNLNREVTHYCVEIDSRAQWKLSDKSKVGDLHSAIIPPRYLQKIPSDDKQKQTGPMSPERRSCELQGT